MIHHQLGAAIASASTPAQLDQLAGTLWRAYAAGQIAEDQAQSLGEALESRRRAFRRPEKGPAVLQVAVTREEPRSAAGRQPGPAPRPRHYGPRQLVLRIPAPARYDRGKSRERRRTLAYSGALPPTLRNCFTPGEQATLTVIGWEVREHGWCELPIDAIAARAGVCRRLAQGALRLAERMGLIRIEERRREGTRNLPNIVTVLSREWLAWIERGDRKQDGQGGCRNMHPTKNPKIFQGKRGRTEQVPLRKVEARHERVSVGDITVPGNIP